MTIKGLNETAFVDDEVLKRSTAIFAEFESAVDKTLERNLAMLSAQPVWGILHYMSERAKEHVESCFVLLSNGYVASSEALCRTALESSINLYYCSLGDSEGKIISYLTEYVRQERDQNKKWRTSIFSPEVGETERFAHKSAIDRKEFAIDIYESVIHELSQEYKKSGSEIIRWPNVYDRFREIGKEVDYRTVYATLCSQAHNDAEDLLNRFIAGVSELQGTSEMQKTENRDFSLFMVLVALKFLVESTAMYLAKFSLGTNNALLPLLNRISDVIVTVMERSSLSGAQQLGKGGSGKAGHSRGR
jgi:hypothetical protein